MDSFEMSFLMADRLKKLREARKLSHVALSNAIYEKYGIEISKDSLINYEADMHSAKKGKNNGMRVEYLRCFADFYGVSADWLLGLTNDYSPRSTAVDELNLSVHAVEKIRLFCADPAMSGIFSRIVDSIHFWVVIREIKNIQAQKRKHDGKPLDNKEEIYVREEIVSAKSELSKNVYAYTNVEILFGDDWLKYSKYRIVKKLEEIVEKEISQEKT